MGYMVFFVLLLMACSQSQDNKKKDVIVVEEVGNEEVIVEEEDDVPVITLLDLMVLKDESNIPKDTKVEMATNVMLRQYGVQ